MEVIRIVAMEIEFFGWELDINRCVDSTRRDNASATVKFGYLLHAVSTMCANQILPRGW